MTETAATSMITLAADRIAEHLGELTFGQLKAALTAALPVLDHEAAEEVGSGCDFSGPALATLNAMATAAGLSPVNREDLEDEDDFFV